MRRRAPRAQAAPPGLVRAATTPHRDPGQQHPDLNDALGVTICDVGTLERWLDQALTAATVAEVLR
ncbi:hypothetical protein [Sorangium sp. So ce1151]|uniref:hypothetical protein n=1 Tax=Sorangium sp. So ce1151 TaxID=3133332 RepID=UPI003F5DD72C